MSKRACIVRQNIYPEDMLVCREAHALRDAGFDVDVICVPSSQRPREEVIDGIHVYRVPPEREKRGLVRYLAEYLSFFVLAAIRLTLLHLRRPYALIQVNTMPDFLVFATLIPRLLGAKVTLQMYEPMPELWMTKFRFAPLIKLLEVMQKLSLRYAHSTFTVTQQLKDTLVARGADPRKINVVLNVPDAHLFGGDTSGLPQTSGGPFTLICHGAIEERYGHDTMLEAIASLRSAIPGIRLQITGKGSYLEQFLAHIEMLELQDHIHYLGFVPLPQLIEELIKADAGIVAQKACSYSHLVHTGKMYDYLHFGKPVIASRLSAVQAYFDEESLCYFTPGDSQDLARAIRYLYEHPKARQRFAQNSRRLYECYRWEQQRVTYVTVSRKVAGLP